MSNTETNKKLAKYAKEMIKKYTNKRYFLDKLKSKKEIMASEMTAEEKLDFNNYKKKTINIVNVVEITGSGSNTSTKYTINEKNFTEKYYYYDRLLFNYDSLLEYSLTNKTDFGLEINQFIADVKRRIIKE